ncbi:MAG TPA: hypothetical protein VGB59_04540 [Allosphingosinicella sp.]|jgi:hypothetical protein
MRGQEDAMMVVRAELCDRLGRLQAPGKRLSEREFAENVGGLKRLAAVYGLTPVVRLADALERSMAEEGRGCPRSLYLGRMQDAIGCEAAGDGAAEAMLASVSVRLSA